jgi:hypothetical protein
MGRSFFTVSFSPASLLSFMNLTSGWFSSGFQRSSSSFFAFILVQALLPTSHDFFATQQTPSHKDVTQSARNPVMALQMLFVPSQAFAGLQFSWVDGWFVERCPPVVHPGVDCLVAGRAEGDALELALSVLTSSDKAALLSSCSQIGLNF